MENSTDFLPLLSMVMDESLDQEDNEIQQYVNEIKLIVDEKLVPAIEEIQYVNKYKIIEKIKKTCKNISLYMYFTGLIGKNLICFYHPNKNLSQGIYSHYLKGTFSADKKDSFRRSDLPALSEKNKYVSLIPDDFPMYIGSDENKSSITCLNTANKSVDVSYREYVSLLKNAQAEKIGLGRIIDAVYVPVIENMGHQVISVIPSACKTGTRYYDTICESADVLIIYGKDFSQELMEKFENISTAFILGNIEEAEREQIRIFCEEKEIKYEFLSENVFKKLKEETYNLNRNNFCFKYYIENQLYEIAWYLAERKAMFEGNIARINLDLLYKDGDEKAGEMIKGIQKQHSAAIDEILKLYSNYKVIVDELVEKIVDLQNHFGIFEEMECQNSHISMKEIMIELLAKIGKTMSAFPESNAKEKIRKYKSLCEFTDDALVPVIYGKYIDENSVSEKIDTVIKKRYKSDFIKHIQVELGLERNVSAQVLEATILTISTPLLPVEYYVLGKAQLERGGEERTRYYLEKALKGGIEEAGNLIVSSYSELDKKVLKELADHGIASAAYQMGKLMLESNYRVEQGLKYLHIAAAKDVIDAIKILGDLSFYKKVFNEKKEFLFQDEFGETKKKSYSIKNQMDDELNHTALKYYLLAERKGLKDTTMFERIANIYMKQENYKAAMDYSIKAGQAGSFYRLGSIYEKGLGCAKDESKALEYYQQAMKYGHIDASVAHDRLTKKINSEKKKNMVKENKSYSSSSYSSGDYYSSGW